jgi:hypothetical protein
MRAAVSFAFVLILFPYLLAVHGIDAFSSVARSMNLSPMVRPPSSLTRIALKARHEALKEMFGAQLTPTPTLSVKQSHQRRIPRPRTKAVCRQFRPAKNKPVHRN